MGKAFKAPKAHHQRKFVISDHAIQRYRERVEAEFKHRSNFDLGNVLDDRIRHCSDFQTVYDTHNGGGETQIYRIEHRDGSHYYAVVRELVVVTVLDAHMIDSNFTNGAWKKGALNMPFNRETLANLVDAVSAGHPGVDRRSPEPPPQMERKGPPPGVPVIQLVHDEPPEPIAMLPMTTHTTSTDINPTAAAGIALADAMVAKARAEAAVDAARARAAEIERAVEQMRAQAESIVDDAIAAKHAAVTEVERAQKALVDAVTNVTKGTV